jgi:hypothetical protein
MSPRKPPPPPAVTIGMASPPRPARKAPPEPLRPAYSARKTDGPESAPPVEVDLDESDARGPAELLAELDAPTRARLERVISKAIAGELGRVRVSSAPPAPSEEPPRSSMRAAAHAGKTAAVKVGVPGLLGAGALTLLGGLVALWRPEYLIPIAKLLLAIAAHYAGSAAPEVVPP